jgi:hypothetical protein
MQAAWMEQLLGAPIPAETRATCQSCAMCTAGPSLLASFNPKTKCCTYLPELPNYLVGRLLSDDDPAGAAGRASVRERIAAGVSVTPLGLGTTTTHRLLDSRPGMFGQSTSIRCPHYVEEGGLCGIWRHRNAVCATWFCKYVRGRTGLSFWRTVLGLLNGIEVDLARWCLLEIGFGVDALEALLPSRAELAPTAADVDARIEATASAAAWGPWVGREEEFYRACGRLVGDATLDQVLGRCGPSVRLRAKLVRAAWERLRAVEPPARLRPGRLTVLRSGATACSVSTYSPYDYIDLHRALLEVLHLFDGRATEEVLDEINRGGPMRLRKELVHQMADFGVLVPVPPQAPSGRVEGRLP